MTFEERLDQLLKLDKENWDTYGARPISKLAVEAAKKVWVSPTVNGGIQLSWDDENASVEFDAAGEIVSICWDRS